MITVIFADTPEEMERSKSILENILSPPKPIVEWLNVHQFGMELFTRGYKASSLATKKKYAALYGIETVRSGHTLLFKNEMEKIPARK